MGRFIDVKVVLLYSRSSFCFGGEDMKLSDLALGEVAKCTHGQPGSSITITFERGGERSTIKGWLVVVDDDDNRYFIERMANGRLPSHQRFKCGDKLLLTFLAGGKTVMAEKIRTGRKRPSGRLISLFVIIDVCDFFMPF